MRGYRLIVVLFACWLALCGWAGESRTLTILHTNDLHGWMRPFDFTKDSTNFSLLEKPMIDARFAARDVGGLARRATAIAQMRRAATTPVVLIDTGDTFTRGPWHTRHYGAPEIDAMNLMGYDMLCVGNNEFKATGRTDAQEKMLALMRQSRFPWLAANLTVGDTGVPVEGIHPFIVRRIGDLRVGFLGLTAPRAKDYPQTRGWTIGDPIEAAKRWAPIARRECDILIAVTHIGYQLDRQLAQAVPGLDAIVGGDSHTFLPAPEMLQGPDGRQVPIVQAGAYGVVLGSCELTFEQADGWRLKNAAGRLILLDKSFADDPAIMRCLERWKIPAPNSEQAGRLHREALWAA